MQIIDIRAIEILDSRGNPTLKSFVTLDDGSVGSAAVPSGASTGIHEALELRDKDDHYMGKGVQKAVHNVNTTLAHELKGMDINKLEKIDLHMLDLDATKDKSFLGANALLSVSLACARAYAIHHHMPLWHALNEYYFSSSQTSFPRLMVNIINGGAHANWNIDLQECMIIPRDSFPTSSLEIAANIFHTLKSILEQRGLSIGVGDEGGFAPDLATNTEAFDLIQQAISDAGYTREQVDIGTDIAASEFYRDGTYHLAKGGTYSQRTLSSADLTEYYQYLIDQYHVYSFEDPFHEDDWFAFTKFVKSYGTEHLVVGDDLFVTNPERIQRGIKEKAANTVLVKVNQIGTLYETVQAITAARKAGWNNVISHRSGETEDTFISDLAVACGAGFIKTGSMSRSERLAKYNRLLEIEKLEY